MYKTLFCVGGCFLLVAATLWGLVDVVNRPCLYLPTRAAPYGAGTFLALPRYSSGGFSLAKQTDGVVRPFPDRSSHTHGVIGNCVDIHLDSRGRLWVLDSGLIDTLRKPIRLNAPRVLVLDADSGKLEKVISLKGLIKGRAQYLNVDENCFGPQYLYVSDGPAHSIVVWDISQNEGHRVILPDRVVAHPVQSKVLYTALVKQKLYFTYLGSFDLFSITTNGLMKGGKVSRAGRKDPRMVFLGVDDNRIVFRLAGKNEVLSWDVRKPLIQDNLEIVDRGDGKFSQMAAVPNFGRLWILDSDVRSFLKGKQPQHFFRPARGNRTHRDLQEVFPEIKTV